MIEAIRKFKWKVKHQEMTENGGRDDYFKKWNNQQSGETQRNK